MDNVFHIISDLHDLEVFRIMIENKTGVSKVMPVYQGNSRRGKLKDTLESGASSALGLQMISHLREIQSQSFGFYRILP